MEVIPAAELKIGMFVVEPDCPWTELSFAFQGFVVTRPEQVAVFREKCRFLSIDRSRSTGEHYAAPKRGRGPALHSAPLPRAEAVDKMPAVAGPLPFRTEPDERKRLRQQRFLDFLHNQQDNDEARALSAELKRVEPHYDKFSQALENAFAAFVKDREIDASALHEGVREIAGSLRRNADAVMWLLRLKNTDEYAFDHALDVSVTMLLVGAHIGLRGKSLYDLGMAGLLQDIGKIQLPSELLLKPGPLSTDDRRLMRSHVASSLEMMVSQTSVSREVMAIVARHHERWDGSGYPRGLRYEEIGLPGEIAGLADSYCAMVRDKPYRDALGHQEALEELHGQRDRKFGPVLMEQFVQCIGLYPIGCLVELDSGEVGVVIQQNRVQRARPRILLMLDAEKQPVRTYRVLDLRDPALAERRIARSVPATAYSLLTHDYYIG